MIKDRIKLTCQPKIQNEKLNVGIRAITNYIQVVESIESEKNKKNPCNTHGTHVHVAVFAPWEASQPNLIFGNHMKARGKKK